MTDCLVEAEVLHYTYPGGAHALQGVSFRVVRGESVGVVGANGAGKSTLLSHLNGSLISDRGTVRIGDNLLTKETLGYVRRAVGMVFQDPDDQLFMPTVYEDVAFGPSNMDLSTKEVEERTLHALQIVGTSHLRDRPPYQLSGGEKRAVTIAGVLSMSPEILVLDEPSSNLDPRARRRLIELLKSFTQTKVIATHDLDLVLDLCDRCIVLHEGRIVADGPTQELFRDATLMVESHLEKPLRMQACPVCGSSAEKGID